MTKYLVSLTNYFFQCLFFDRRGYFEISVFEISRVDFIAQGCGLIIKDILWLVQNMRCVHKAELLRRGSSDAGQNEPNLSMIIYKSTNTPFYMYLQS